MEYNAATYREGSTSTSIAMKWPSRGITRRKKFQEKYFQFFAYVHVQCMFMHSPFLEGWPRILLTVVLVNKTEIGTEIYNSLTLFLKCSINLLSLYRKKKSTPVCLIRLKRFQPFPLFSPFLSLIPTVRGTQPLIKGSSQGEKDLRGLLREIAVWLLYLIFAHFSQE